MGSNTNKSEGFGRHRKLPVSFDDLDRLDGWLLRELLQRSLNEACSDVISLNDEQQPLDSTMIDAPSALPDLP